jgi:hypothetical protein
MTVSLQSAFRLSVVAEALIANGFFVDAEYA